MEIQTKILQNSKKVLHIYIYIHIYISFCPGLSKHLSPIEKVKTNFKQNVRVIHRFPIHDTYFLSLIAFFSNYKTNIWFLPNIWKTQKSTNIKTKYPSHLPKASFYRPRNFFLLDTFLNVSNCI